MGKSKEKMGEGRAGVNPPFRLSVAEVIGIE
jgi:hypothetical protein